LRAGVFACKRDSTAGARSGRSRDSYLVIAWNETNRGLAVLTGETQRLGSNKDICAYGQAVDYYDCGRQIVGSLELCGLESADGGRLRGHGGHGRASRERDLQVGLSTALERYADAIVLISVFGNSDVVKSGSQPVDQRFAEFIGDPSRKLVDVDRSTGRHGSDAQSSRGHDFGCGALDEPSALQIGEHLVGRRISVGNALSRGSTHDLVGNHRKAESSER